MKTLAIDTSSRYCIVALFDGAKVIGHSAYVHENQLSSTLVPAIETLLKSNDLTSSDLGRIAGGMGPGSYTGTRVGVSVAKSLSFALQIPFLGFCSLGAFLPKTKGSLGMVLPTRFQSFFFAKIEEMKLCASGLMDEKELNSQVADIFCCEDPTLLPVGLRESSLKNSTPNIENLALFLDQNPSSHFEELIYLHNPL